MNADNRIAVKGTAQKKPAAKGLTVRIVGAEGDLPLAIIVRQIGATAVRIVLHPRRAEGVGLHNDGKIVRRWMAEGTDSPMAGWKLCLSPKSTAAQVDELEAEASAGKARGVTAGKWTGEAKASGEGIKLTLTRTMGANTVRVESLAFGWTGAANGNAVGEHPTFTQTVSAALQALVFAPTKRSCPPPPPRRGKASDMPPTPKRGKAAEPPPAPPVLEAPPKAPRAPRAPRAADKKPAKAPKASKDKEPAAAAVVTPPNQAAAASPPPPSPSNRPSRPTRAPKASEAEVFEARVLREAQDELRAALTAYQSPRAEALGIAAPRAFEAIEAATRRLQVDDLVPYGLLLDHEAELRPLGLQPDPTPNLSREWSLVRRRFLRGEPVTLGAVASASRLAALTVLEYLDDVPHQGRYDNETRLNVRSNLVVKPEIISGADLARRIGLKRQEGTRQTVIVPVPWALPNGELADNDLRGLWASKGYVTLVQLDDYSSVAATKAAALMRVEHLAKPFRLKDAADQVRRVPRKVMEAIGLGALLPALVGPASKDQLLQRLVAGEILTPADLNEVHGSIAVEALRLEGVPEARWEDEKGALWPLTDAGLGQIVELFGLKRDASGRWARVPGVKPQLRPPTVQAPTATDEAVVDRWAATDDQLAALIPWDVFRRAHQHTSHDPEGRATREQRGLVALVKSRRAALQSVVSKAPQMEPEARRILDRYVDGLTRAKTRQLQGNANVVSVLVAGPDGMRGVSQRRRAQWAKRDDDDMQALKKVEDAFTSSLNGLMRQAAPKSAAATRAAEERAEEQGSWVEQTIDLPSGGTVEYAVADERLRIRLPTRPDPELAARLKRSGWLWSPKNTAWQRKLTLNARMSAAQILDVSLPPLDGSGARTATSRTVVAPPPPVGAPRPPSPAPTISTAREFRPDWLAPLGRLPEGASFNDIKGAPRPLVDAAGRRYTQRNMIVLTALDGSGPVIPSNDPRTLRPMDPRRYPPEFQARTLANIAEVSKIQAMRRDFEPWRVLAENGDATLGAPIVWEAPDGALLVLAGNGRTLALFGASQHLTAYQSELHSAHIAIWPIVWQGVAVNVPAPRGYTWMLVRLIAKDDDRPLSQAEAAAFAAASQASTSAGESPLGSAVSFARGLGLDSAAALGQLGPLRWRDRIGADNVADFVQFNAAWVEAMLATMDGAKRQRTRSDPALLAQAVLSVMTARLPKIVLQEGFSSENEERALIGALPILLTLESSIQARQVEPRWGLLNEVDAARRFALRVRGKSDEAAVVAVERGAQQQQLDGMRTLWDDLTPLGVCLGLLFKRASKARDPSIPVVDVLGRYVETAGADVPGQASMFASVAADPATTFASLLKVRLPAQTRA